MAKVQMWCSMKCRNCGEQLYKADVVHDDTRAGLEDERLKLFDEAFAAYNRHRVTHEKPYGGHLRFSELVL